VHNTNDEYELWIEPIKDQMFRAVWRITRNPDDADDAFQEALLVLWKRWDRIRRHPNPSALILRICINAAYDAMRRKARERKKESLHNMEGVLADSSRPVTDALEREEVEQALYSAIGKLLRNQSHAVHMRYIEGFSYGAIALAIGCKEVTVRKHVSRALNRLKELLAPVLDEPGVSPEEVVK
jgi:RNA polymerase sigma-70 factor (ECF subfamily)